MAKAKRTTRAAPSLLSLRREFQRMDRRWKKADQAYKAAAATARSHYPKPGEELERILLLNRDLFGGETSAPVAKHEVALVELCGRGDKNGAHFDTSYNNLKDWRAWKVRCRQIDGNCSLDRLKAEADEARRLRKLARDAFEEKPAANAEEIALKLKHFLNCDSDDAPRLMLWGMIENLRSMKATLRQ